MVRTLESIEATRMLADLQLGWLTCTTTQHRICHGAHSIVLAHNALVEFLGLCADNKEGRVSCVKIQRKQGEARTVSCS